MEFEVKVVQLSEVVPHPDADRLDLAYIAGQDYQCVVAKGQHQPGDTLVYIPTGALVPDELMQQLGLWDPEKNVGRLSGKENNRVTALRLRGRVSQGLLAPVPAGAALGDEVADRLGVTKYLPPIPEDMAGKVKEALNQTPDYDISDVKKWPQIFQEGEPVCYTEKLHGTLSCFGYIPGTDDDQLYDRSTLIASKIMLEKSTFMAVPENDRNVYVRAFKQHWLETGKWQQVKELAQATGAPLYIFGEIFGPGIQHLRYGLENKTYRVFDIYQGWPHQGRFLDFAEYHALLAEWQMPAVPLLYAGPHFNAVMLEHREGPTVITENAHHREGLVISPEVERSDRELGRVKLKAVSETYLFSKGRKTEFN